MWWGGGEAGQAGAERTGVWGEASRAWMVAAWGTGARGFFPRFRAGGRRFEARRLETRLREAPRARRRGGRGVVARRMAVSARFFSVGLVVVSAMCWSAVRQASRAEVAHCRLESLTRAMTWARASWKSGV